jgi:hypothetical protein
VGYTTSPVLKTGWATGPCRSKTSVTSQIRAFSVRARTPQRSESEQRCGDPRRPPGGAVDEPVAPRRRTESSSEAAWVAELVDGFRLCFGALHPLLFELVGGRAEVIARFVDDPCLAKATLGRQGVTQFLQPLVDGSATACLQSSLLACQAAGRVACIGDR